MDLRKGTAVDLRRCRAYLRIASEGRSTDRRGEAPQYFHHSEMPPPSPLDARVGAEVRSSPRLPSCADRRGCSVGRGGVGSSAGDWGGRASVRGEGGAVDL